MDKESMNEIKENLPQTVVENGIVYTLAPVTETYLPCFEQSLEEPVEIKHWGRMREKYLKEEKDVLYQEMILNNTLNQHLQEIDNKAFEMQQQIIQLMAEADGTDETLKITDMMKWVGLMNNYRAAADEIIMKEIIFV